MKKLLGIAIACLFFVGCASTGPSDNCTNGKCSQGWITDENTGCKVCKEKGARLNLIFNLGFLYKL